MSNVKSISKILSPNDTGETGSHQSGLLIPKDKKILSFFPTLGTDFKNPRVNLKFTDNSHQEWGFVFIYYNNQYFGGTRNEFRLTRTTAFIRENDLESGDEVIFSRTADNKYTVSYSRKNSESQPTGSVLRIGNAWKVISI